MSDSQSLQSASKACVQLSSKLQPPHIMWQTYNMQSMPDGDCRHSTASGSMSYAMSSLSSSSPSWQAVMHRYSKPPENPCTPALTKASGTSPPLHATGCLYATPTCQPRIILKLCAVTTPVTCFCCAAVDLPVVSPLCFGLASRHCSDHLTT